MSFEQFRLARYQCVPTTPTEPPPPGLRDYASDIVAHLPVLEYFSSLCSHITEFGTRDAHSTVAFLAGCRGEVVSYDLMPTHAVEYLKQIHLPTFWQFHQADTGAEGFDIAPTDLIFFDTLHTYEHLKKELRVAHRARKYLAFHDTQTCGLTDRSGPNPNAKGILPAITEYIQTSPRELKTVYWTNRNNGLWILEITT